LKLTILWIWKERDTLKLILYELSLFIDWSADFKNGVDKQKLWLPVDINIKIQKILNVCQRYEWKGLHADTTVKLYNGKINPSTWKAFVNKTTKEVYYGWGNLRLGQFYILLGFLLIFNFLFFACWVCYGVVFIIGPM
jgi:hypothetical protein